MPELGGYIGSAGFTNSNITSILLPFSPHTLLGSVCLISGGLFACNSPWQL